MAIFKCDSCGYERDVPDKLIGKKAKCPDCGHGVTIAEFVAEHAQSFEAEFEDADGQASPSDVVPDPEIESDEDGGDSYDLDDEHHELDFEDDEEDTLCAGCGTAVNGDHDGNCPSCGEELPDADDAVGVSEDDVDISDLADDDEAQIWDEDYADAEGDASIDARDEPEDDSPGLLEGNFALNVFAGLASGALAVFFALAMAILAVSQDGLHQFLPYVLTSSLTAMAIGCFFYSLRSRIPFALLGPEVITIVVFFHFLGALFRDMEGRYSENEVLATLLAAIVVTALLVGASIWLLGRLRAGEYVRFIPVHIIGGVIGALGIFTLLGLFDWAGQSTWDWNNSFSVISACIVELKSPECYFSVGPSILFGLVLFFALRRHKNSLFMLALVLVASGGGYVAGLWGGDVVIRSLAEPVFHFQKGMEAFPVLFLKAGYGDVQWGVIKANGLYIGALGVLMILTTMFRLTRLEIVHGREAALDDEFRWMGLVNMLSGLCGGLPASLSYGRSVGSYSSGGRGPVAGVVAGLVCGAGLYFADDLIPMIPRYVPEGIIVFAGLDIARDWLFKTRSSFTRRDDIWMLWTTFFVTLLLGLLMGIGFGVALAMMVTVSRYSKDGAVRNILSGANHRSNVDRAPAQQRTLKEYGDHIYILRLQGFLFLGSMERLLQDIRKRFQATDKLPVEYLILDFKLVKGLASAANIGFDKLRTIAQESDLQVIITSPPLELEEHLEKSGHVGEGEDQFRAFFNLDYAMEWCENHVLEAENMLETKQLSLPDLLGPVFPEPKYIPALMKVLKRVDVKRGEAVFRQGDVSDSMYFVESGRLEVELELEGGKLLRLKKIGPGAVFGEMGIFTTAPRSATVRASDNCVLYKMTQAKLEAVEKRAPALVTAINRYLISMMSERLADANIKVRDLML